MNYKNKIEFAKGWKGSFADFKKEFQNVWVFKELDEKTREKEMKKTHKQLTAETKKLEADQKKNGNTTSTAKQSKDT